MSDVTNPGLVNVADQGYDGLVSVDQTKIVTPTGSIGLATVSGFGGAYEPDSTNPGSVNVADETFGQKLPANIFV
jgi:hypothetical protein